MRIRRTTPINHIEIKTPMWKNRTIGIANYKVCDQNAIDIMAINSETGERYYPNTLYATREQIIKHDKMTVGQGTVLYQVPISELETLERTD
jgi:hypothetical protein